MDNTPHNDSTAELSKQQSLERKEELAKLRTLDLEFAGVLAYFPKLRKEFHALLLGSNVIAFDGLVERLRTTLKQAAKFQFEIECLPKAVLHTPEMQEFLWKTVHETMGLQMVELFAAKFQEVESLAKKQAEAVGKRRECVKAAIPEMVAIPAGRFTMGCVDGRDDIEGGNFDVAKPSHEVSITAFAMGKYPVTFAQFDAFCEATGFKKPADEGWGRGNRPVINVSWDDAQTYIQWLCEVTGKAFRLPSEAEWEYAARGGDDQHAYPWGQTANASRANFGGAAGRTTPVGQYPANGFGLYDMHGNVWEWCQDAWHTDYQGAPTTGAVWAGGDTSLRVLRGGSWGGHALRLRSAHRSGGTPDLRGNYYGFRLVLGQA